MRMRVIVATTIWAVVLLAPRAALADGGAEDFSAKDYVEQAIGLLQGQPEMGDLIGDRIGDALEDDEAEGVDLTLVTEAQAAFDQGDAGQALELLARSIGEQVGPALHQPEVGGGLKAPGGVGGPVLVVLAAALIGLGALVALRMR